MIDNTRLVQEFGVQYRPYRERVLQIINDCRAEIGQAADQRLMQAGLVGDMLGARSYHSGHQGIAERSKRYASSADHYLKVKLCRIASTAIGNGVLRVRNSEARRLL